MRVESEAVAVYAGVDTHKDTHTLALLDGLCRVIGTWEFATGEAGYEELERVIGDASVQVGIEGAASYGAGLASYLQHRGYEVFEMVRPKRSQRRRGKSDPIDAIAAAKNLAAGEGLPVKSREGAAGAVSWLMLAREHAVRQMTAASNCIDPIVVTAPERIRAKYGDLSGEARARKLAASRPSDACGEALKRFAKRFIAAKNEADELEAEIEGLLKEAYPALIGSRGIGTISAARLVVAAGSNPERMKSEAAFSMLCGTSPVPASSGRTDRFRLNRGGDRQANRAIHEIARTRMTNDKRTQDYIAKRISEGKTKKEAIRCLCRFIAREVYGLITGPQEPLPDAAALSERRKELGLTQSDVARALGMHKMKVSRLERSIAIERVCLVAYESFLEEYASGDVENHVENFSQIAS